MKNKKDRGSLQAPGTNGHIRWKQINIAFLCARNRDRTHPSWFVSGQYSFDSTCTYSYICFQKSIRSLFCSLSFWAAFILTHGFLFENSLYLIVRDKHWLSRWYFLCMNETSTYSWLKSRASCASWWNWGKLIKFSLVSFSEIESPSLLVRRGSLSLLRGRKSNLVRIQQARHPSRRIRWWRSAS